MQPTGFPRGRNRDSHIFFLKENRSLLGMPRDAVARGSSPEKKLCAADIRGRRISPLNQIKFSNKVGIFKQRSTIDTETSAGGESASESRSYGSFTWEPLPTPTRRTRAAMDDPGRIPPPLPLTLVNSLSPVEKSNKIHPALSECSSKSSELSEVMFKSCEDVFFTPMGSKEDILTPVVGPHPGGVGHGTGRCRPCAWFHQPGKCNFGEECFYCHFCPPDEIKRRRKEKIQAFKTAEFIARMGCDSDSEYKSNIKIKTPKK